jgi:hypothetical protein
MHISGSFATLVVVPSFFCLPVSATPTTPQHAEIPASRSYFYVGGNYVTTSTGTLFENQMYVEKLIPSTPAQPYPVVFIHGQAQTGTVGPAPRPPNYHVTDTQVLELVE